jgi:SulP family sulfate permease
VILGLGRGAAEATLRAVQQRPITVDLIVAVGLGVVLASLLFVKQMADLQLANIKVITEGRGEMLLTRDEQEILDRSAGKIVLVYIDGPMSFGPAKAMVREFELMPGVRKFKSLVMDLSEVPTVDGTGALAIEDILRIIRAHKQHVFFSGMQPAVQETLEKTATIPLIPPEHLHASRPDALRHAASAAGSTDPKDAQVS